jgi:hypothetical protein
VTGKQARQGLLSFNTTEKTEKMLEMSGKIREGRESFILAPYVEERESKQRV